MFAGAALGLHAADLLLELDQLRAQGVLLSQDTGNHGLGLVSGQVRLEARRLFWVTYVHVLCAIKERVFWFVCWRM